jgi:hypothetical protein
MRAGTKGCKRGRGGLPPNEVEVKRTFLVDRDTRRGEIFNAPSSAEIEAGFTPW